MSGDKTPTIRTRSQRIALCAFERIQAYEERSKDDREKYVGFAKRFPSLIHSCGLAQAIAFAAAKAPTGYVDDFSAVVSFDGNFTTADLGQRIRAAELPEYLRLSRIALEAAGWLKRYAEAVLEPQKGGASHAGQS